MKVTCTRCVAPVPVVNGRVGKHLQQIVAAHGWVNGYRECESAGQKLNLTQLRELQAPEPEELAPPPAAFPADFAEVARVIEQIPRFIKEARLAQGFSLRRLGAHLRMSYKTIDRIERGEGMYTDSLMALLRWLEGHNLTVRAVAEERRLREQLPDLQETARILRGAA
jgi:ribosome-binding protein aMBF1 (putative translation factor)